MITDVASCYTRKICFRLLRATEKIVNDSRCNLLLSAILLKDVVQCGVTLAGAWYTGSLTLMILTIIYLPFLYLTMAVMIDRRRASDWLRRKLEAYPVT